MSRDNWTLPITDINAALADVKDALAAAEAAVGALKQKLAAVEASTVGAKAVVFIPDTLLTPPADWQPPVEVKVVDMIINAADSHNGDPAAIVDAIAVGHALVPVIDSAFYTAMTTPAGGSGDGSSNG